MRASSGPGCVGQYWQGGAGTLIEDRGIEGVEDWRLVKEEHVMCPKKTPLSGLCRCQKVT